MRTTGISVRLAATSLALLSLSAIASAQDVTFAFVIDQSQEVPPTGSAATGVGCVTLDTNTNLLSWNMSFSGLSTAQTGAHFHRAPAGSNGPIQIGLPLGSPIIGSQVITAAQRTQLLAGNWYVNVHSTMFPGGEIRGQVVAAPTLGNRFCPAVPNSTGATGRMDVFGSNVDARDCLTLTATQLPTNSNIGYFIMGTGTNTFTPPGSAGPICVAPGLKRYLPPVNNTNSLPGGFSRVVGTQGVQHPVSVNITPGSTWSFQAWHRDSMAGTSNLTDAIGITFN